MTIIGRKRGLKFNKIRIKRYKVKVKRIGALRAFVYDFNQGMWHEIRAAFRESVGWRYIATHERVVQVRWFWTYKACVKAVQEDVAQGLALPEVLIRMQQGTRVASMFHDIRKESVSHEKDPIRTRRSQGTYSIR